MDLPLHYIVDSDSHDDNEVEVGGPASLLLHGLNVFSWVLHFI
jgi:hypothetical protein